MALEMTLKSPCPSKFHATRLASELLFLEVDREEQMGRANGKSKWEEQMVSSHCDTNWWVALVTLNEKWNKRV